MSFTKLEIPESLNSSRREIERFFVNIENEINTLKLLSANINKPQIIKMDKYFSETDSAVNKIIFIN